MESSPKLPILPKLQSPRPPSFPPPLRFARLGFAGHAANLRFTEEFFFAGGNTTLLLRTSCNNARARTHAHTHH